MRARSTISAFVVGALTAGSAFAATPGYVDDFNSGLGQWGGGSETYELLLGGVDGAADNFLRVANETFAGNLGARNTDAPFVGDLTADGVTGYSVWLKDIGADDNLEIHFGVGGAFSNYWISNAGFMPSETEWQEFTVDLSNPADWTQVIGGGTFADAIAATDRILIRYDTPPIDNPPPTIQADFGIDNVRVLPEPMTGLALLFGGAFALRRRK